jgi:riboflavin synthase
MFTGIVEELGTFLGGRDGRFRVGARAVLEGVTLGDSIAVNGCCLTVVAWEAQDGDREAAAADTAGGTWWEADLSGETLERTNLGRLRPGDPVNLERPVRLMDRLGGHLVQGHVDAVGTIVAPVPDLEVTIPEALTRYCVEKGSITVDGVSLTIVACREGRVSFAIIPHTSAVTTLGRKGPGDPVNLEVDVMAKHAEQLLQPYLDRLDRLDRADRLDQAERLDEPAPASGREPHPLEQR